MHDDFYQMYLEEMGDIVPCTKKEQEELLKEAAAGNKEARKRLIEGNLRAALEYAREFDGKGVLLTDLVQEANMAFVLAVEDYIKGDNLLEFDSFAGERIRKALEVSVEEQQFADRTGEELTARVNVLTKVSQAMAEELKREPSIEELADKMKMTVDEIRNIMKMAMDAMSLSGEEMNLEELGEAGDLGLMEGEEE